MYFFVVETGKLILQFIWKCKGLSRAKMIFKNNKVGGLILPDFKTCYKATVIKAVKHWLGE